MNDGNNVSNGGKYSITFIAVIIIEGLPVAVDFFMLSSVQ